MEDIYKQIWDLSLPYQDLRNDKSHALIVYEFALKLCDKLNGDKTIALPAAILHDIGWSKVSKEKRDYAVSPDKNKDKEKVIRIKHEKEGKILANEILNKVNYPKEKINLILNIIDGHDTRKEFLSKEDGIVKDSDKLWRYTKKGILLDIERGHSKEFLINKLKDRLETYFYSEESKKIAIEELNKFI